MGQCTSMEPGEFKVALVDAAETQIGAGTLIVTDHELLLNQEGKEEMRWELCHLKRFGYDQRYFSFEATKKCTSGRGIFALRTRQAKRIFKAVDARVGDTQNGAQTGDKSHEVRKVQYSRVTVTPGASRSTGASVVSTCDGSSQSDLTTPVDTVSHGDAATPSSQRLKINPYAKVAAGSTGPKFVFDASKQSSAHAGSPSLVKGTASSGDVEVILQKTTPACLGTADNDSGFVMPEADLIYHGAGAAAGAAADSNSDSRATTPPITTVVAPTAVRVPSIGPDTQACALVALV